MSEDFQDSDDPDDLSEVLGAPESLDKDDLNGELYDDLSELCGISRSVESKVKDDLNDDFAELLETSRLEES